MTSLSTIHWSVWEAKQMMKRKLYKMLFLVSISVLAAAFLTTYLSAFARLISPEREVYGLWENLLITIPVSFFMGCVYASFEVLYFTNLFRRRSFGYTLAVKTVFYISTLFFFMSIGSFFGISAALNMPLFHSDVMSTYVDYISSLVFVMGMVYWGFTILLALFILQINEKFGQGVLLNFLLGKYHRPKEEKRIFMFMDLKSSTTYAEKLGHIRYSQLIQDCFYDLTDIVAEYDANIYQYVGDEVVLSWNIEKGIRHGNCVNAFFAYDDFIQKRKEYYLNKYGVVPEFKAGMNVGDVTVAEVGEIKKELAYHGDVLNTASRIQDQCNEYQRKLLVSQQMKTHCEKESTYSFESIGNIILKGKIKSVDIYAVNTI
jgi:adenylate cyclase